MKYPAPTIANYFIRKAHEHGQTLTPMKLIKLVYLAHGWNLALQQQALIDEPIAAWRYGPVIASLYHQFKKFGNDGVTEYAPSSDHDLYNDSNTLALLDRIWEVYGKYTGVQLSTLTHEQDSPWDIAWNKQKGKDNYNHAISDQIIQDYYAEQAKINTAM
jgi:uncharacterized phage-associated protein